MIHEPLEKQVESAIDSRNYNQIGSLLRTRGEDVLNLLYQRTREGKIDLRTEADRQIWSYVINYYRETKDKEKVDTICSNLIEYSRINFLKGFDEILYDLLFAIHGGVTGDIRAGRELANKFAKRRLQKILQG